MAVSGLEPRMPRLFHRDPKWQPWGPKGVPLCSLEVGTGATRRCKSWGGYQVVALVPTIAHERFQEYAIESGPVQSSDGAAPITTLMITNLPERFSIRQVLQAIDKNFGEQYDYCHIPRNMKTGATHGKIFVNFISVAVAERFRAQWEGKRNWFGNHRRTKPLVISPADIQGSEACSALARQKDSLRNDMFRHKLRHGTKCTPYDSELPVSQVAQNELNR